MIDFLGGIGHADCEIWAFVLLLDGSGFTKAQHPCAADAEGCERTKCVCMSAVLHIGEILEWISTIDKVVLCKR